MRACIQRVSRAQVDVEGDCVGKITNGLLVLLGIGKDDTDDDLDWLANKIANLRIFEDDQGKMNLALKEVGGAMLVVSQFTLYGDCRKGRRPSFVTAAPPEQAERMVEQFVQSIVERGIRVATGRFQAQMQVELINDGPVTLWLDSAERGHLT